MADREAIGRAFRDAYGRAVAVLVGAFGDIDAAEEAVQDAFVVALERWPLSGPPPNPAGWIVTTARRRAIDRHRQDAARAARHARLDPGEVEGAVAGLAAIEGLDLDGHHLYHAIRAELLRRLGRAAEAAAAITTALELTANRAEQSWLRRRLRSVREEAAAG